MKRFALGLLCAAISFAPAHARDGSQWAQASPERKQFFKEAKQPDDHVPPPASCCGDADAYEADDFETDAAGNLVAIITCNDPENCKQTAPYDDGEGGTVTAPPRRPAGSRFVISPAKILRPHEPENHTGHGWVFISDGGSIYCYAFPFGG